MTYIKPVNEQIGKDQPYGFHGPKTGRHYVYVQGGERLNVAEIDAEWLVEGNADKKWSSEIAWEYDNAPIFPKALRNTKAQVTTTPKAGKDSS